MIRPQQNKAPVPFSEILRVIGAYVDRNRLSEIRVLEAQDALILQGRLTQGANAGQVETYQLTSDDILALLQDAYALRGKKV
jgi:hypothetical protein